MPGLGVSAQVRLWKLLASHFDAAGSRARRGCLLLGPCSGHADCEISKGVYTFICHTKAGREPFV